MEGIRNTYKILVEENEEKTPLWRPRYRWQHMIKLELDEKVCRDVNWIQ
jgi:hypothetical protein